MAPPKAATAAAAEEKASRRNGIITCLFYGQICRLDPVGRTRARRARIVPRRVPRLVVSLAAGDQRLAVDLDGDTAQGPDCPLRRRLDAGLDCRLLRALLPRPERRRRADPQAVRP